MERDDRWRRLTFIVAVLITVGWAVTFTLDVASPSYEQPPGITPLMLATAGYLFGGDVVHRITGKKSDEAEI